MESKGAEKTKNILVTNDDGIRSDGILTLARALSRVGRVTVVAPDRERSAVGHALTFFNPIRVTSMESSQDNAAFYAIDGTPTDCVILGVNQIMDEKPDVVVSGINRGANMGDDITYSGTVAGAMEGTIQGIPSIAVSLTSFDCNDFTVAADFTRNVVLHLFKRKISPGVFLNINVPGVRLEEIEGVSVTFQGRSRYSQKVVKRVDPFKRDYFWICGEPPVGDLMPGSDFDAISRNRISITPLQLSLTCREYMAELEKWDLFKKNC